MELHNKPPGQRQCLDATQLVSTYTSDQAVQTSSNFLHVMINILVIYAELLEIQHMQ